MDPIDYQDAYYFSAPGDRVKYDSIDDVPQEILDDFEKLGIPLREQAALAGVAVDAVMDSVSRRDHVQGRAGQGRRHLLLL